MRHLRGTLLEVLRVSDSDPSKLSEATVDPPLGSRGLDVNSRASCAPPLPPTHPPDACPSNTIQRTVRFIPPGGWSTLTTALPEVLGVAEIQLKYSMMLIWGNYNKQLRNSSRQNAISNLGLSKTESQDCLMGGVVQHNTTRDTRHTQRGGSSRRKTHRQQAPRRTGQTGWRGGAARPWLGPGHAAARGSAC